jgi:DNA-binding NarL/FixJ family response regulator
MIVVDGHEPGRAAALADRWGLQGSLPLSSSTDVAAAAIRLVVAGGAYRPHEAGATQPAPHAHALPEPEEAVLTPREQSVLELLGRGLPNKTIAHELSMSLGTVKVHVHNIMAKFKVRNRTAAAVAQPGRGSACASLAARRQTRPKCEAGAPDGSASRRPRGIRTCCWMQLTLV